MKEIKLLSKDKFKKYIKSGLNDIFKMPGPTDRKNIDNIRKNLKIEELNDEEWKKIHTACLSLKLVPQIIEDTYGNLKERLGKLNLDEYIDQLTREKRDFAEWINKVLDDLESKWKEKEHFNIGKGENISEEIRILFPLVVEIRGNIEKARGEIERRLKVYANQYLLNFSEGD